MKISTQLRAGSTTGVGNGQGFEYWSARSTLSKPSVGVTCSGQPPRKPGSTELAVTKLRASAFGSSLAKL